MPPRRPTALTIAGSDSGGGAGIQADLKTFAAFGVFGTSAITALTAQNTQGVRFVHAAPGGFVAAQIDAVLEDIGAGGVKTGMLANAEIVVAVAARLAVHGVRNLVVDPVMVAKGGTPLLEPAAVDAVRRHLLPLAAVVTPNVPEAAALLGDHEPVHDLAGMRDAARRIAALGARTVLLKGGHLTLEAGVALDIFYDPARGEFIELRGACVDSRLTHGTGCALSAAIAAGLARGEPLEAAVRMAKDWLTRALAAGFVPGNGRGHGSPDHAVRPF